MFLFFSSLRRREQWSQAERAKLWPDQYKSRFVGGSSSPPPNLGSELEAGFQLRRITIYDSATQSHLLSGTDPIPPIPPQHASSLGILDIAKVTINTLREIGVENCCFIGGMACKLYTGSKVTNQRCVTVQTLRNAHTSAHLLIICIRTLISFTSPLPWRYGGHQATTLREG